MAKKEYYNFGEIIHGLRGYYEEEQEQLNIIRANVKVAGSDVKSKIYVESYESERPLNIYEDEEEEYDEETKVKLVVEKDPAKSLRTRIINYRSFKDYRTYAEYTLVKDGDKFKFIKDGWPSERALQPDITITDQEAVKKAVEKLEQTKWYSLRTSGEFININQLFMIDAKGIEFRTEREGKGRVIYSYDAETDTVNLHFDRKFDGISGHLLLNQRIPGFIFDKEMRDAIEANIEDDSYGIVSVDKVPTERDNIYKVYDYPKRMILVKKEDK